MSFPVPNSLLQIEDIGKLRAAAIQSVGDFPHRPLLLELALVGLSRASIANLTMASFKQHTKGVYDGKETNIPYAVVWRQRNNVERVTSLTEGQWRTAMHYIQWRMQHSRSTPQTDRLFLARGRAAERSYYQPMRPERVRSEMRSLGRDARVGEGLEIPPLHEVMAKWMRLSGISQKVIDEFYPRDKDHGTKRVGQRAYPVEE